MTTVLLYILIVCTVIASLARPWIGVLAYYTVVLLSPKSIWWWVFGDVRLVLIISLAVIAGCAISVIQGTSNTSILLNKQNLYLAVIWLFINISYLFNPYGHNGSDVSYLNSTLLLTGINKIYFFYFIVIILVNSKKHYHYLIMMFIGIILYYIYWANNQYFGGHMTGPRLAGPGGISGGGMYRDENTFAMLFVVGSAFLYFMGSYYQNKLVKYALWGAIPLGWHAIFLTGSRGGLLGIGMVSLVIVLRSRSKLIGMTLVVALVVAFTLQGGDYLKGRSNTIVNYEGEGSAEGRLKAWAVGWRMLLDHPVTGIGLGNFTAVLPDYSDEIMIVCHNTVVQLASETGFIPPLMYLLMFRTLFWRYWKQQSKQVDPMLKASYDAIIAGLAGFFLCAMFLNLFTYEVLYFLLVLNVVQNHLVKVDDESMAVVSRKLGTVA